MAHKIFKFVKNLPTIIKYIYFRRMGKNLMNNYFRAANSVGKFGDYEVNFAIAEQICPVILEYKEKGKICASRAAELKKMFSN